MIKRDELSDPNSCLNKAADDEPVFVLLGRDEAAPETIRGWAHARVISGKNKKTDSQILEAIELAERMDAWRAKRVKE